MLMRVLLYSWRGILPTSRTLFFKSSVIISTGEFQKVPRVVASMLIGDLRRILKCAVFLKENRILLLTEELDLHSRYELHENLRKFIDVGFECRNFHGDFTISHVGHYPDLVSIAAHVIVDGLDQSVLEEFCKNWLSPKISPVLVTWPPHGQDGFLEKATLKN